MSIKLASAALLAALAPAAVLADTVTLTTPHDAVVLQGETTDLRVHFTDGAEGAYEVVARYGTDAAPHHLVMALQDGDDVSFSLPGHDETLYNFKRVGGILTVTGEPATFSPLSGS